MPQFTLSPYRKQRWNKLAKLMRAAGIDPDQPCFVPILPLETLLDRERSHWAELDRIFAAWRRTPKREVAA